MEFSDLFHFKNVDELEIFRLYDTPCFKIIESVLTHTLSSSGAEEESYDAKTQSSQRQREEGNRLFKAKLEKRDVLGACRLYTRAIFAASEDSVTLALAHANRAMALQEFGYFRQAYDDCVCALELGYPEHLRPKIVARQATCALYLGEVALVQRHLDDLDAMPLKGSIVNNVRELRERLAEFLGQQKNEKAAEGQIVEEGKLALQKRQNIVHTAGQAGRFMVAAQAIAQHELIFSDYATVFVPLKGKMMCQQCARTELIPFPCKRCRVVYCSYKCRAAHAQIHAFECAGYRLGLFDEVLPMHVMALRMLLEGLPRAIPLLRHKRNAQALWVALVCKGSCSVAANDAIAYAQMLRLVHHLDSMDKAELGNHVGVAYALMLYLKNCTGFFKLTEGTAATRRDWELLTAALILRHIGQVTVNSVLYWSFVPLFSKDYTLLCDAVWSGPLRIHCGRLHQFNHRPLALAIFPHLSMCNHVCERSFVPRFSGRNMHAFALDELRAGAQITRCYTDDYWNSNRQSRFELLKQIYNFVCECAKCERANPDADYKNCHRYRCDNLKCRQVFVPHLPQNETLKWWDEESDFAGKVSIKCTVCGVEQSFKWLERMENLFEQVRHPTSRHLLYRRFEELNNWLLDQHEFKLILAVKVLSSCIAAHYEMSHSEWRPKFSVNTPGGSLLADAEFTILIQIAKFVLSATERRSSNFSAEYVRGMSFLWDLIALGKYRCTREEFKTMLRAVNLLSDEFQTIYMNYYRDYIEQLLLS